MRSAKSCAAQAFLVLEAKRMVREAAQAKGGEKIKAQVRNASRNLDIDYGMALRAFNGRIGTRAFPILYLAYSLFVARQEGLAETELVALERRIERLEKTLEGTHSETADMDGEQGP